VVVVSDQNQRHGTNAEDPSIWPSVLIVPISSKTSMKTQFCVKIAAREANLPRKG